jgi:hypothetical protein
LIRLHDFFSPSQTEDRPFADHSGSRCD